MASRSEAPKRSSEAQAIDGLPVIRYNVAGIDLGSKEHWVCAPSKGDRGREIAKFGATTPELLRMAQGLKERPRWNRWRWTARECIGSRRMRY